MEQTLQDLPDWVREAQPEVLRDLWCARFGKDWIPGYEVRDDYSFVLIKLLKNKMAEKHKLFALTPSREPMFVYRVLKEGQA